MIVFIDTSALLSVLDADERNHARAARSWRSLIEKDSALVTTNYVLIETFALVQHRLGIEAVRVVQSDLVPVLRIGWIDEQTHERATAALLAASRRRLSLVDCVSFEFMRREGIRKAFSFDRDFTAMGFERIP